MLNFDVYQLDSGLGFFRDARIIKSLKARGKKIICCYTGSDLRVRGVIPEIDAIADLIVSVEFDHQFLHPGLTHVPFPINPEKYPKAAPFNGGKLRISHSPTNRQAKGSHIIIPVVEALAREYPVELVLIENMSYQQALSVKASTHIFIDQIGDLGYGISGLEALCMGIPVCSCVAAGFEKQYPNHPFIVIDENNLREQLLHLITDPAYRQKKSREGWSWVNHVHQSRVVAASIHQLAGF